MYCIFYAMIITGGALCVTSLFRDCLEMTTVKVLKTDNRSCQVFQVRVDDMTQATKIYRSALPEITKIENINGLVLKMPAARQSGSPMIGSQEKKRDQTPHFLNNCCALSDFSTLIRRSFEITKSAPQMPIR